MEAAREAFRAGVGHNPTAPQLLLEWGLCEAGAGELARALDLLKEGARLPDPHPPLLEALAAVAARAGEAGLAAEAEGGLARATRAEEQRRRTAQLSRATWKDHAQRQQREWGAAAEEGEGGAGEQQQKAAGAGVTARERQGEGDEGGGHAAQAQQQHGGSSATTLPGGGGSGEMLPAA